ncbi:hypothetical protein GW17_00010548 [Ensete ventricosum]|uniref:Uncharacterized protein n=1 Tax=Ensete ventricosum TaxID=4639 RepID=A0A426ZU56_ENSVE|nr:hypothetical protein B296_00022728 [Ensete ventricosum]RWW25128.1 hypothetical protein GW17_00010548 [Ensete ventricosum]
MQKVSPWKKVHVIYSFFFVRKVVAHIVTFVFYCIVIPATVLVPEVEIPKWGAIYIPSIITLLNAVGTPRSLHLLVFWILFENVMSLHRTKATFIGLLEAGRVNEWVVTEKLGDTKKTTKMAAKAARKPRIRIGDRCIDLCALDVESYCDLCSCRSVSCRNQIASAGAVDGSLPLLLWVLRCGLREQPFLHLPLPPSNGFLHRGFWLRRHIRSQHLSSCSAHVLPKASHDFIFYLDQLRKLESSLRCAAA